MRRTLLCAAAVVALVGAAPAASEPFRVVIVGDSLTDDKACGFPLRPFNICQFAPKSNMYAQLVQAELAEEGVEIQIAAQAGSRSQDWLPSARPWTLSVDPRQLWAADLLPLLDEPVDLVVVHLELNDAVWSVSRERRRRNLETLAQALFEQGARRLMFAGGNPTCRDAQGFGGEGLGPKADGILAETIAYAQETESVTFGPDLRDTLSLGDLWACDLHWKVGGHRKAADAFKDAIRQARKHHERCERRGTRRRVCD